MTPYPLASTSVKSPVRTQRKPILRIPEAMLARQAAAFPESFERNSVLAMFALRALAQRINDYNNDSLAPFGLNAAKFNYMIVLYFSERGEVTLNELSQLIHTTNASVTAMVSTLERDGFVRRRVNRDDARSVKVRLTAKGCKLVERASPAHHHNLEAGMSDLSIAEREQLVGLLLRVGASFDRHFTQQACPGKKVALVW